MVKFPKPVPIRLSAFIRKSTTENDFFQISTISLYKLLPSASNGAIREWPCKTI